MWVVWKVCVWCSGVGTSVVKTALLRFLSLLNLQIVGCICWTLVSGTFPDVFKNHSEVLIASNPINKKVNKSLFLETSVLTEEPYHHESEG